MLSIQLNIAALRIVIVGGGPVAARKAAAVLAAGATDVTAISPAFCEEFPIGVKRIEQLFDPALLAGAALVFATTNRSEVNDAIVAAARAIGAFANRADTSDETPGDFTLPAKADLGDIRLTVTAGSAALSAAIRDQVVAQFDPRWIALAEAMKTLRPWIVAQKQLSASQRAAIFRDLASEEAASVANDVESLRSWIAIQHANLVPSPGTPGEG